MKSVEKTHRKQKNQSAITSAATAVAKERVAAIWAFCHGVRLSALLWRVTAIFDTRSTLARIGSKEDLGLYCQGLSVVTSKYY